MQALTQLQQVRYTVTGGFMLIIGTVQDRNLLIATYNISPFESPNNKPLWTKIKHFTYHLTEDEWTTEQLLAFIYFKKQPIGTLWAHVKQNSVFKVEFK